MQHFARNRTVSRKNPLLLMGLDYIFTHINNISWGLRIIKVSHSETKNDKFIVVLLYQTHSLYGEIQKEQKLNMQFISKAF